MAYLAAANVTVTLAQKDIIPLGMSKKMTFPSIAYGNGVLQYPALGIPMPVKGNFGFKAQIDRVFIEQPANGFVYHFDRTNHKLRIFLGAAVAITVANHTNITLPTPTGNVAAPANHVNIALPAPTGNIANLVAAAHSHDLVIAANDQGAEDVSVGINAANNALVSNIANATTIAGGNATLGGIANTTPGNSSGDFVGDTPSNLANLTHSAPAFTGDAPANLANLTHTVTGSTAEAALAEMDAGVAPAATTLYMEMIGR